MKEPDVKLILSWLGLSWESFALFMRGQTISEAEDGTPIYWTSDVKRFLCEQLCEKKI